MLKFVNSGLSQTEVRRLRAMRSTEPMVTRAWNVLLPLVATVLAAGVLAELVLGIYAIVVVSILGGMLVAWAMLRLRAAVAVVNDQHERVQVVREGLIRRVSVADLVAGDALVLGSGAIAPVDVRVNQHVIGAGETVTDDVVAIVVAVGTDRKLAQEMNVTSKAFTIEDLLDVVRALAAIRPAGVILPRIQYFADAALTSAARVLIATMMKVSKLAGTMAHMVSRERAIAFRHNQGPVSWLQTQYAQSI